MHNILHIHFQSRVIALWRFFSGFGFRTKAPKVLKLENQIKWICTRYIEVVQLGFRFLFIFDLASEGRGRKSTFENSSFLGHFFFRNNTSLVHILLDTIDQRLFNFYQCIIWTEAEGAGPLGSYRFGPWNLPV